MRRSYLESYYNLLPSTQQSRLLSVLQSRANAGIQTPNQADLSGQLVALIAQIRKPLGQPMVQLRKAPKFAKMSSKDYNDTMDEVYVDLGALFNQDNAITSTTMVHDSLNEAVLKDISSALEKVSTDIEVHQIIKNNKVGITDAKFNSFYKDDNTTAEDVFVAQIDTDTNAIKLPKGIDHSTISTSGLSMAHIDIKRFGGGIVGTTEDEAHRKEKAIDGDGSTFWAEVILTDEPIRQVYNDKTYFGTIGEVIITLFRADLVNHVKLNPFCNYPLSIIGIQYSETESGAWVDLAVTPQESTSFMEFNFMEVLVKRIKIILNQKNPSIDTYKLPRRVVDNAMLWQQIVNREYSISTSTSEPTQATQDMIDYVSGWQAYVDASNSYRNTLSLMGTPDSYTATKSISESVFDAATKEMVKSGVAEVSAPLKLDLYGKKPPANDELIEVRKYEYVYGAYDISIKKIWYLDKGEYVSPMYTSNGNIVDVMMDATYVSPSGTTIEFQVATRDQEWRNVMPYTTQIINERLDLDSVTKAGNLRFECATSNVDAVYRNGILIPPTDYTFTKSSGKIVMGDGWYTDLASFTVSYQPAGVNDVSPSGVSISFLGDSTQDATEIITGSQSRQYKIPLTHFPYIEYHIVNNTSKAGATSPQFSEEDGRFLNISGVTAYGIAPGAYYDVISVLVNGFVAIDRTDYYNDIKPALNAYNDVNYPYYEFIHAGKNLYFNVPLKDKTVKAKYKYLNDFVQFKALLRSNTRGDVSSTPLLEDFTLKLRTI
jgi:hypothetical protein